MSEKNKKSKKRNSDARKRRVHSLFFQVRRVMSSFGFIHFRCSLFLLVLFFVAASSQKLNVIKIKDENKSKSKKSTIKSVIDSSKQLIAGRSML